jgi:ACR3 family arsenite efflux pump ArsB
MFCACAGLALGFFTAFGESSAHLIIVFLMSLLFFVFLAIDLRDIKKSFGNVKFAVSSLSINFIWTPLFAFLLGEIFLDISLDLRIGFLMLMVTPCTDWYLVFTGLAKGNVELGAAILPINLILQVLLLPVYLLLFFGSAFQFNASDVVKNIILVLILPFTLAQITNITVRKTKKAKLSLEKLMKSSDNFQLLFLCLAVISMFASEGKSIIGNPIIFLRIFIPLCIFFVVNFVLARFIAGKLKFKFQDSVALNMTTLARNSPLSLAVAVAAFPDRPLISLALVIGPLIELPVLAIASNVLLRIGNNRAIL